MSVFKVTLNNSVQGALDLNPTGADSSLNTLGSEFNPSIQRKVYIMGPNRINRQLSDGQTFTDVNFWKKYAYPTLPLDQAFITVVTDDGSFWSDTNPSENVYPVTFLPGTNGTLVAGNTYTNANYSLDIVATYGAPATFAEIQNLDATHPCKVELNGSASAIFTLAGGATQIFDNGDFTLSKISFDNSASGASNVSTVQVILGIKPTATS